MSMNELVKAHHMKSDEAPFLFSSELRHNFPELMLVPNIQELQQTLNNCIKCMLQSTEQVQTFVMAKFPDNSEQNNQNQSGKGRNVPDKCGRGDKERDLEDKSDQNGLSVAQREELRAKNYFNYLTGHYPTIALIISMTNKMRDFQPQITDYIAKFQKYSSIWEQQDGESAFAAFKAKEPSIREIKEKVDNFVDLESKIKEIPEKTILRPIYVDCSSVKNALSLETKKWKQKYGDLLNYIEKQNIAFSKEIVAFDDLRLTIDALKLVREKSA